MVFHRLVCWALYVWATRRNPQHTAVASVAQNVKWSYTWVDAESNRLARWMQLRGIGPGSNVGMFLPRSAEVLLR